MQQDGEGSAVIGYCEKKGGEENEGRGAGVGHVKLKDKIKWSGRGNE